MHLVRRFERCPRVGRSEGVHQPAQELAKHSSTRTRMQVRVALSGRLVTLSLVSIQTSLCAPLHRTLGFMCFDDNAKIQAIQHNAIPFLVALLTGTLAIM
jgi:hypothetical protein